MNSTDSSWKDLGKEFDELLETHPLDDPVAFINKDSIEKITELINRAIATELAELEFLFGPLEMKTIYSCDKESNFYGAIISISKAEDHVDFTMKEDEDADEAEKEAD